MQTSFRSRLAVTAVAVLVFSLIGMDVYRHWKVPVTQAQQTTCWDNPNKRFKAPNKTVYYDCNADGEVDRVSTEHKRIKLIPPNQNIPSDYHMEGKFKIYGGSSLAPPGTLIYEHISSESPEGKRYAAEFRTLSKKPKFP